MDYKQRDAMLDKARDIWAKLEETKYPVEKIKTVVDAAHIGAKIGDTSVAVIANAMAAQVMIAYNEMIDAKIKESKETWRVYGHIK